MKKLIQFIAILFVMSTALFALTWERMFPEINGYVQDIEQGSVAGVGNYGYVFASSGLKYYNLSNELVSRNTGLPLKSVACRNGYDEIYCPVGMGSESDAFYSYKTSTDSFYFEFWTFEPKFIKRLPSGMYYGDRDGLRFASSGIGFNPVEGFDRKFVFDAEETGDGKLFVSAYGGELLMKNGTIVDTITSTFPNINDVYVRSYPNNNVVLVTLGTGTYSDGLYKVLYNDSTIIGFELIDWIFEANLITEHIDSYIVTCKNSADIYIVPFDTGVARHHDHGLDITNIYCISDQYPIYTPNFMIGTDKGVFMCTGDTGIENGELKIGNYELQQNYPNPFNNETMIPFKLDTNSDVSINIFNSNGEQVKQVSLGKMNKGAHEYKLSTDNFSAGQYFYSLSINGKVSGSKKMLYLR